MRYLKLYFQRYVDFSPEILKQLSSIETFQENSKIRISEIHAHKVKENFKYTFYTFSGGGTDIFYFKTLLLCMMHGHITNDK